MACCALLGSRPGWAQEVPSPDAAPIVVPEAVTVELAGGNVVPQATNIQLIDCPNDDGSALLVIFTMQGGDETRLGAQLLLDGEWRDCKLRTTKLSTVSTVADNPQWFGWNPPNPDDYVFTVDGYMELTPPSPERLAEDPLAEPTWEPVDLVIGEPYQVRLGVYEGDAVMYFDVGTAATTESWFNTAGVNNIVISVVFAIIIMAFIMAARRNPNLFIRRISGLEAVDEAIGRATEMGKPVLQINGLDPLSQLATIAAVNILGRIARKVANYDSTLLVPCFDPVVMTVSQEVVKNAYLEAGRPDAYREDNIYFVTDQQFSYVATVCGIMERDKPAANFLLGYFYAEALMLAETGFATGAIQIAGTDALAQLPFFITTCDYTLIGEELYAASAYLSREPMLLGSLKGQDVGKAFIMIVLLVGTILATCHIDWLTNLLTALI